jgi:hypothetical protein
LSDNPFDASAWRPVEGFGDLTDITHHRRIEDATVSELLAERHGSVALACERHGSVTLAGPRPRF